MFSNGKPPGQGAANSVGIIKVDAAENTHLAPTTQEIGTFELVVTPAGRGRFTARFGNRVIVKSSRQPLLDAARALLAAGVAPNARIGLRHAGAGHVALTATVGKAARLTVTERARDGLVVELWKPFRSPAVSPPIGFFRDPVSDPSPRHQTASLRAAPPLPAGPLGFLNRAGGRR